MDNLKISFIHYRDRYVKYWQKLQSLQSILRDDYLPEAIFEDYKEVLED